MPRPKRPFPSRSTPRVENQGEGRPASLQAASFSTRPPPEAAASPPQRSVPNISPTRSAKSAREASKSSMYPHRVQSRVDVVFAPSGREDAETTGQQPQAGSLMNCISPPHCQDSRLPVLLLQFGCQSFCIAYFFQISRWLRNFSSHGPQPNDRNGVDGGYMCKRNFTKCKYIFTYAFCSLARRMLRCHADSANRGDPRYDRPGTTGRMEFGRHIDAAYFLL